MIELQEKLFIGAYEGKVCQKVQATYKNVSTRVQTQQGDTEDFMIEVGVHQGSALSPFLFINVMDTLTKMVRKEAPWELIFANDVALVAKTEAELQERVKDWQNNLANGGLKVNAEKSEVMVMDRKGQPQIYVEDTSGRRLRQRDSFKYLGLGSEVAAVGGSLEAVKQRVKAGWNKWREITGVICDKKIPLKSKCKVYKTVIRPVLLYGAECWTVGKKEEGLMRRTEMRMLRWILGISLRDKIRSEDIRKRSGVTDIVDKMQESRLRWYGHISRREVEQDIRRVMEMEVEGNRGRGRPKRRWLDCVEKDMEVKRLTKEDAENRGKWRRNIRAADPRTVWD